MGLSAFFTKIVEKGVNAMGGGRINGNIRFSIFLTKEMNNCWESTVFLHVQGLVAAWKM